MPERIQLVPTLVVSCVKVVALRRVLHFISSFCDDGCLFLFLSIPPLPWCGVPRVDKIELVVW